jgi:hypothetical protein
MATAPSAEKPLPNAFATAAASATAAAAAASCTRGRELGGANTPQTKREPHFRLPHLLTQTLGT